MGSDRHEPEEAPSISSPSTASGCSDTRSRTNSSVDSSTPPATPPWPNVPSIPPTSQVRPSRTCNPGRWSSLRPGAGRSGRPQPVVAMAAGRLLAAAGRPGEQPRAAPGPSRRPRRLRGRRGLRRLGRSGATDRSGVGTRRSRRSRRRGLHVGDDERPDGRIMANHWDGPDFPWRSSGESGFDRTVASLSSGAAQGDQGRLHLCSATYCLRYRPAARRPQMIDTGMSHIGFRCIIRPPSR